MATYLITGSSRGLGLALVAQLALQPAGKISKIIASSRGKPTAELQKVIDSSSHRAVWVQLDVVDKASVQQAATQVESILEGKGLDVLINNSGVIKWQEARIETMDDLENQFSVNVAGAHNVTSAFIPLLKRGSLKKIAFLSTTVGSITLAPKYALFNTPAYKVTKAAENMLAVQYSLYFKDEGFTVVSISPGWLRTDLGGPSADLSAEEGANAVLDIVHKNGPEANGKFFNIRVAGWENKEGLNQYDGSNPPW